jgi:hypothetical protein
MHRVLLAAALLVAAGCQTQNPFAAIGPATVPAPTTGQQPPYYPAIGTAPAALPSGRVSVSADSAPRLSTTSSAIVAEPADREPIRIVENSSPTIRTATAPSRGATTDANVAPPPNRAPTSQPPGQPSSYTPPPASPATSRIRGFAAGTSSSNSTSPRTVAPAGYQQPVPTFTEITPADGQWRAR